MANMGLFEYMETHPGKEPEPIKKEPQKDYRQRREELERAGELLQSIEEQLKQGAEPQYILYTALKAIGIYANNAEWAERQRARLDAVYDDLAQRSLFIDEAAVAAERLDKKQHDYLDRMRRRLQSNLRDCQKIERELEDTLRAVNNAETVKEPDILE